MFKKKVDRNHGQKASRNTIIKMERVSNLSDSYRQNNRMHASVVQLKHVELVAKVVQTLST